MENVRIGISDVDTIQIDSSSVIVYEIDITVTSPFHGWQIKRRYTDFYNLYIYMTTKNKPRYLSYKIPSLTTSSHIQSFLTPKTLAYKRIKKLQNYLSCLLSLNDLNFNEIEVLKTFIDYKQYEIFLDNYNNRSRKMVTVNDIERSFLKIENIIQVNRVLFLEKPNDEIDNNNNNTSYSYNPSEDRHNISQLIRTPSSTTSNPDIDRMCNDDNNNINDNCNESVILSPLSRKDEQRNRSGSCFSVELDHEQNLIWRTVPEIVDKLPKQVEGYNEEENEEQNINEEVKQQNIEQKLNLLELESTENNQYNIIERDSMIKEERKTDSPNRVTYHHSISNPESTSRSNSGKNTPNKSNNITTRSSSSDTLRINSSLTPNNSNNNNNNNNNSRPHSIGISSPFLHSAEGLKEAVKNNNVPLIKDMLQTNPSLATYCDNQGNPIIYTCALYNNIPVALILLDYSADPFVVNMNGLSPLDIGTTKWKEAILERFNQKKQQNDNKVLNSQRIQNFNVTIIKQKTGIGLKLGKNPIGRAIIVGFTPQFQQIEFLKNSNNNSSNNNSPVKQMNLKICDVIHEINGVEIKDYQEIVNRLKQFQPGDFIDLTILRSIDNL